MESLALTTIEPGALAPVSEQEQAMLRREAGLTQITLDALTSEHSRRAYQRALADFWAWYRAQGRPPLRKAVIQRYAAEMKREGRSAANINQRLCAIRRMLREGAENLLIDEQDARSGRAVEGMSAPGSSAGAWLDKDQVETLLRTIDRQTLAGKRDFALFCLFIASGLRRSEMAGLTVEKFQQTGGRWALPGIIGKRNKKRDVPLPGWAKHAVDLWREAAGITSGVVFRPINKGDKLAGERMTPEAIRKVIDRQLKRINDHLAKQGRASLPSIAAHDLRRTFAQLARKGNAPIEQIQFTLGHASVATTERYLGGKQDLTNAPCDQLGLSVSV